MHGAVHDWIILNTVKDGMGYPSGESSGGGAVRDHLEYTYTPPITDQPVFPRILDIGALDVCGSVKTYNFINRGPKWTEIVGCQEFIGLDIQSGAGVDIVADAHDIPFGSNSFDLVTCVSMLEHDSDPQKTIKEAYRVLKKGQPFLLTTVNQQHDEHQDFAGSTHVYNKITAKQLKAWVTKAGFKSIELIESKTNLLVRGVK